MDKNLAGPFTIGRSPLIPPTVLATNAPSLSSSHPGDLTALPLHQNNIVIILFGPLDPISVPLLYYLLVIVVLVGDSHLFSSLHRHI
jgi:hypothetical protein